MRIFIAITLPENIKYYLKEIQNTLIKEPKGFSLAKDYHLTFKFLGNIDEEQINPIKKALSTIKSKSFTFSLDKIGFFPGHKMLRVVWLGIQPETDVLELQSLIDQSLIKSFPKEKKFKPHITLARVKFLKNKEEFLQNASKLSVKNLEVGVKDFRLMKSTLTKQGAVYGDLEVYPLDTS